MIKMAMAIQPKPARKPAVAPQDRLVSLLFRNMARLTAMTKVQISARTSVLAIPVFGPSGLILFARIQAFPNKTGEYQSAPNTKALRVATTIANQFSVERF